MTDEFRDNVNRFQKVPAIVDKDFKLSESVAIFRYLAAKNKIDDNWYPQDLQLRGRIDEYLEWQHANTRMTCSYYFILKYLKPRMAGKEPGDDQVVMSSLRQMEDTLDTMEDLWLSDKPKTFIGGLEQISFADLLAVCELEQPSMCRLHCPYQISKTKTIIYIINNIFTGVAGYEPGDGRPKIQNWLNSVKELTNPHYDEAHKFVYKLSGQASAEENAVPKYFKG